MGLAEDIKYFQVVGIEVQVQLQVFVDFVESSVL